MIINKVLTAGVDADPVLLWTNPSPNDYLWSRTLTLETGFNGYLVEFKVRSSSSYPYLLSTGIMCVTFGSSRYSGFIYPSNYSTTLDGVGVSTVNREITASDGTLRFSTGYVGENYENASVCIPLRIWGVPWTL